MTDEAAQGGPEAVGSAMPDGCTNNKLGRSHRGEIPVRRYCFVHYTQRQNISLPTGKTQWRRDPSTFPCPARCRPDRKLCT